MDSRASGQDSFVGIELGHYRIVEKIGAGGMGEVYRARDEHLDRDVAIKVLPPRTFSDDSTRKHFRREALALSRLDHPNIATVHDFDTQQGIDFLVMEYVPGVTLSEKLANHALPEKEITRLGLQLVEGLAAAHEQGVIHRDLKPNNLRLTPEGRLKILDFGLAKLAQPASPEAGTESETQTGAGTLPYMSPEQLRGEAVDARSDIWAAGTVLYEMATGHTAFHEKTATATADAILHKPVAPPGRLAHELSPQLEDIILKCLEKEAENRYQSAKELAVDLRRLLTPSTVTRSIPRRRFGRSETISLAAAGSVAVLLTLILGLNPGGLRDKLFSATAHTRISSLAVLPLANLSGDPQQEYFADGMTEALITEMSKIGSLKVISRTSVMQYKDAKKSVREIARELGVMGVVEGSVLRSGDRVRISAQLIDAREDRHLWADSYDRDLRDVLALHGEVARAIVDQVRVVVTPEERQRLAGARSVNPEAYQAYLKGDYLLEKRTGNDIRRARDSFQHAIEIDPNYAMGYAGLAESYYLAGGYGVLTNEEADSRTEAAARKALELDDTLAAPHALLAGIRLQRDWDWVGAEKEFKRARELEPGNAKVHYGYGFRYLFPAGRLDEGIAEMKRALELAPLSLMTNANLGIMLRVRDEVRGGSFDDAIEQCRKTLELDNKFLPAQMCLGQAYQAKGMYVEAATQLSRCAAAGIDECLRKLAVVYVLSGRRAEGLKLLGEMREPYKKPGTEAYHLWMIYAALGDKDQAFTWLEKSYEKREFSLLYIRYCTTDPACKQLSSDLRFRDVVRRMNFPQ